MSGSSDLKDCPRCGGKECLHVYVDWKPHDTVEGECDQCGYRFWTDHDLLDVDEVNELREEVELPPVTELKPPTTDWLKFGWEPEPPPEA